MKKYQPENSYDGNEEFDKKYCLYHEIFVKLSNLSKPNSHRKLK